MNEKNLTEQIFNKISNERELILVCNSFRWLIENGFIKREFNLYVCANNAARRIYTK